MKKASPRPSGRDRDWTGQAPARTSPHKHTMKGSGLLSESHKLHLQAHGVLPVLFLPPSKPKACGSRHRCTRHHPQGVCLGGVCTPDSATTETEGTCSHIGLCKRSLRPLVPLTMRPGLLCAQVSGLEETITEEGLRYLFSALVPVLDVRLVHDRFTGTGVPRGIFIDGVPAHDDADVSPCPRAGAPRGFGFVEFNTIADAARALNTLQVCHVLPAFLTSLL